MASKRKTKAPPKAPATVRVHITCGSAIHYDQTREMTLAEWRRLRATSERVLEDGMGPIGNWLDLHDVNDTLDYHEIEMEVVDADGRPTGERYEGGK